MADIAREKPSVESFYNAFAISGSDTVDLAHPTVGLWVGVAGAVKVTMRNGDVVVLGGMQAGMVHPLSVTRVWSTGGTTATGIVGIY